MQRHHQQQFRVVILSAGLLADCSTNLHRLGGIPQVAVEEDGAVPLSSALDAVVRVGPDGVGVAWPLRPDITGVRCQTLEEALRCACGMLACELRDAFVLAANGSALARHAPGSVGQFALCKERSLNTDIYLHGNVMPPAALQITPEDSAHKPSWWKNAEGHNNGMISPRYDHDKLENPFEVGGWGNSAPPQPPSHQRWSANPGMAEWVLGSLEVVSREPYGVVAVLNHQGVLDRTWHMKVAMAQAPCMSSPLPSRKSSSIRDRLQKIRTNQATLSHACSSHYRRLPINQPAALRAPPGATMTTSLYPRRDLRAGDNVKSWRDRSYSHAPPTVTLSPRLPQLVSSMQKEAAELQESLKRLC